MTLLEADRRLARVTAAIVLGRWDELRALRAAAPPGEPDRAWREAVLQTHLFAGFPRLVEAYEVLSGCGGLGAPEADELAPEAPDAVRARGRALFERIYADAAERVRGRLAAQRSDFAGWIEDHAYGRVLSRPGLAPGRREVLACCALAATGQDRQLASHARGALRCGAGPDELAAALDAIAPALGTAAHERARRIVARLLAAG